MRVAHQEAKRPDPRLIGTLPWNVRDWERSEHAGFTIGPPDLHGLGKAIGNPTGLRALRQEGADGEACIPYNGERDGGGRTSHLKARVGSWARQMYGPFQPAIGCCSEQQR